MISCVWGLMINFNWVKHFESVWCTWWCTESLENILSEVYARGWCVAVTWFQNFKFIVTRINGRWEQRAVNNTTLLVRTFCNVTNDVALFLNHCSSNDGRSGGQITCCVHRVIDTLEGRADDDDQLRYVTHAMSSQDLFMTSLIELSCCQCYTELTQAISSETRSELCDVSAFSRQQN